MSIIRWFKYKDIDVRASYFIASGVCTHLHMDTITFGAITVYDFPEFIKLLQAAYDALPSVIAEAADV